MKYFQKLPYNIAFIGAANGIGFATAELLSADGASVACLDINFDGARETY